MQHFLNVSEIALQPSNAKEFDGQSWKVARLYAEKVQQKVDRGSSWVAFEHKYGADSHPHELMAAQIKLAPRALNKSPPRRTDRKDKTCDKRPRTMWNTSQAENKCRYEVENEGKKCDRTHECSWYKEKIKQSMPHQRSFCRQRLAAGEQ